MSRLPYSKLTPAKPWSCWCFFLLDRLPSPTPTAFSSITYDSAHRHLALAQASSFKSNAPDHPKCTTQPAVFFEQAALVAQSCPYRLAAHQHASITPRIPSPSHHEPSLSWLYHQAHHCRCHRCCNYCCLSSSRYPGRLGTLSSIPTIPEPPLQADILHPKRFKY